MIENTPIYAITCLEKIETDANNTGFPDFGATAFMGFYYDKKIAFDAVQENRADIAEHCYRYVVIERILPGLYSYPRDRWFFEYDHSKNRFITIAEPSVMNHIAGVL